MLQNSRLLFSYFNMNSCVLSKTGPCDMEAGKE